MGFNCNNFYYFYWNTNVSDWNKKYFLLEKNYMNLYLIYRKNCNFLPDSLFIALFNLRGLATLSHAYFCKKNEKQNKLELCNVFRILPKKPLLFGITTVKNIRFSQVFLSRLKEKTVNTSVMNAKYRQSAFEKCC